MDAALIYLRYKLTFPLFNCTSKSLFIGGGRKRKELALPFLEAFVEPEPLLLLLDGEILKSITEALQFNQNR